MFKIGAYCQKRAGEAADLEAISLCGVELEAILESMTEDPATQITEDPNPNTGGRVLEPPLPLGPTSPLPRGPWELWARYGGPHPPSASLR